MGVNGNGSNTDQVLALTKMVRKLRVPHYKIEFQAEVDAMNAINEALDINHRFKVGDEYVILAFPL